LYTALGRLPAAWEALADLQSAKRLPCESAVASAWLHLAAGDPAAANTTVASVLDGRLATPVHPFTLTEAWLVDAVARAEQGDDATASTSLERALREAAAERYTQVFVEGGASVPALLARQMELGTEHASFVAKLQGIVEAHPSPGQRQPAVLSEPLTTRELTVLRHLPSRLSIQEIAQELHVSVNTVKSQVRSIYRKLGASGRRDAVVRAKRLRLL
jgi:LuxR family maltose regulon positive regulatory protein